MAKKTQTVAGGVYRVVIQLRRLNPARSRCAASPVSA
jgi:hypothetical protein